MKTPTTLKKRTMSAIERLNSKLCQWLIAHLTHSQMLIILAAVSFGSGAAIACEMMMAMLRAGVLQ